MGLFGGIIFSLVIIRNSCWFIRIVRVLMSPAASTSKNTGEAKPSLAASMDSFADGGDNDAAEARFTEFCKVYYKHIPTHLWSI